MGVFRHPRSRSKCGMTNNFKPRLFGAGHDENKSPAVSNLLTKKEQAAAAKKRLGKLKVATKIIAMGAVSGVETDKQQPIIKAKFKRPPANNMKSPFPKAFTHPPKSIYP